MISAIAEISGGKNDEHKRTGRKQKTTSPVGRPWGWPNLEEEMGYVQRIKQDFYPVEAVMGPGCKAVVAVSNVVEYPDEGVQCVQTETWVKM